MKLDDKQYMQMAHMAKTHADCLKRHVGATLVLADGSVIFGANRTPRGHTRCVDGGCYRCAHSGLFEAGKAYDVCNCVHAEEVCLTTAAQHGLVVEGATIYTTLRPCRECSKQLIQAGVLAVYYEREALPTDADQCADYVRLQEAFPGGVKQMESLPIIMFAESEVRVKVPVVN